MSELNERSSTPSTEENVAFDRSRSSGQQSDTCTFVQSVITNGGDFEWKSFIRTWCFRSNQRYSLRDFSIHTITKDFSLPTLHICNYYITSSRKIFLRKKIEYWLIKDCLGTFFPIVPAASVGLRIIINNLCQSQYPQKTNLQLDWHDCCKSN